MCGILRIEPASRPSDEAEIEMISIIAIKDPASRELFELQIAMHPPNDLDEASEILFDMLRGTGSVARKSTSSSRAAATLSRWSSRRQPQNRRLR